MASDTIVWLALSTLLVLLMQAGFACFEAGIVRAKNSINVALKNIADLGVSVTLFLAVGYALMYGADVTGAGLVGWTSPPILGEDSDRLFWSLFQAMFAGTAITVVSGAVSERTSFRGYIAIATGMSLLVYPITGHWAWAPDGWLNRLGFYDFAGGTVVHVVGGAIALGAVLRIGPRLGRFDGDGEIEPFNLSVSAVGAFLLMFGWFGFNAGIAVTAQSKIPVILVNTAIGGAVGIVGCLAMTAARRRQLKAQELFTAMLGGLTSVTAGCAVVQPVGAAVLGAGGAVAAVIGVSLLARARIDDPVGAIPIHLIGGMLGTLLTPFVALDAAVPAVHSGRIDWFLVQLLGASAIAGYALALSYGFIRLTDRFVGYRVSAEAERIGLNIAEHGASSSLIDLLTQMARQGDGGDFTRPIRVEPETEAAHIAAFYNGVRVRFLAEARRAEESLREARFLAHHDALTGLPNRRAFSEAATRKIAEIERGGRPVAVAVLDVDRFKAVNDTHGHDVGDEVLRGFAERLRARAREDEFVARLGGEEFAILLSSPAADGAIFAAERFRLAVAESPFETAAGPLRVTSSFGVALVGPGAGLDAALREADQALYRAKRAGRNRVELAVPAAVSA